jgi:alkylation response protein AidB-like acyl-CoA dehydrogenase
MKIDETMSEVRRAALDLGSLIGAEADEIERQRRLTSPVVEAMKRAGIFAMAMPKSWGGSSIYLNSCASSKPFRASTARSVGAQRSASAPAMPLRGSPMRPAANSCRT